MPASGGLLRRNAGFIPSLLLTLDSLTLVLTAVLAFGLRGWLLPFEPSGNYSLLVLLAVVTAGILFSRFGLYDSWRGRALGSLLGRLLGAWVLLGLSLTAALFLAQLGNAYSRVWFSLWMGLTLVGTLTTRLGLYQLLRRWRSRGGNRKRLLLVGAGDLGRDLAARIRRAPWSGWEIVGFLDDDPQLQGRRVAGAPVEPVERVADLLEERDVEEVWIALPLRAQERVEAVLHLLRHSTVNIRYLPDIFAFRLINHGFTEVLGLPLIDLSASPMQGRNRWLKAIEDRLLAALILLLISPLLLVIALAVRLTSPGPVFYRQERIGWNGRPFAMLKFRTMPVDSERQGVQWGQSYAKPMTPIGAFLRRTSLDELPQFLNVLRGEMSIVGPRPERPMFVEQFKDEVPDYMKKHLVKAGITGWAQVNGLRGDTDLARRIEYDLYYIENWSLGFDLRIIWLTLWKGWSGPNVY